MKNLLLVVLIALAPGLAAQAFPEYYNISDIIQAQAEARQRQLPLAFFGGDPTFLSPTESPSQDMSKLDPLASANNASSSDDQTSARRDLTSMAMSCLQGKSVVVFFPGTNMGPVPSIVHAQYHMEDDGPLPNGASWIDPKIVFTDPAISHTLRRVSYTQMKADRETPLNAALQAIAQNPRALADTSSSTGTSDTPSTSPASEDSVGTAGSLDPADGGEDDMSPDEEQVWGWLKQNGIYVGVGVVVLLLALHAGSRKPET